MISTLRPLPLCPTLNEHPPTLPLHLGNLPHDFQGPVGCVSNSGPRQQNCTVLKSCQPFLHSRSRRQLATYAGPPRLAPESATAPAVPPPRGRVDQAGAVSLDTCCASSRPDFWKADFPRSTLNFTPFYLLDLELDLWDDLHHDPFPGFAPAVCCMIPGQRMSTGDSVPFFLALMPFPCCQHKLSARGSLLLSGLQVCWGRSWAGP